MITDKPLFFTIGYSQRMDRFGTLRRSMFCIKGNNTDCHLILTYNIKKCFT